MIESAPIPGLAHLPDGLVAILLTLAWCANATAAAVCLPGWRGSLIAAELAAAGFKPVRLLAEQQGIRFVEGLRGI